MEREGDIIVVGGRSAAVDPSLLRTVRGSFFNKTDFRFVLIAIVSVGLHAGILGGLRLVKLQHKKVQTLEEMPERFAKLIVNKPIPKEKKPAVSKQATTAGQEVQTGASAKPPETAEQATTGGKQIDAHEKAVAQKRVAAQVARVEQKIRTVGVLGMLTGVGTTARGPAVVDVLGSVNKGKEKTQDLEKALSDMSGLQQTASVDVAQKKLVKSKDVEVSHRENVDELLTSITTAKTQDLSKKGNIIISRPQSIEGAASSNAKRDITAINDVVNTHKVSIRMSYERFLKRSPDLAGKITIRFTIDAAGNVSRVEIVENTTGNKDLEDEINRKVAMWKFEAIGEGEVTVTYPFIFQPAS
jgi:TonB family protein